MQPVVHLERRRGAVGMLYLRPCAPGEGSFVKFADHAGLLPRQAAGRRSVFTRRTPADARIRAGLTESSWTLRSGDAFVLFPGRAVACRHTFVSVTNPGFVVPSHGWEHHG